MNKLQGKVACITGAGSGIGRSIANRFAHEGALVAVVDNKISLAENACLEITKDGGIAVAYFCDVSNQDQVNATISAIEDRLGPIDLLINNAGGAIVGGEMQRFSECTREYMDTLIGVNLMGTLFCSRAVVSGMKSRQRGKIINLSSIRGVVGDKNNILYGTAKGAIISFTKSLAMEMGAYGVTVNAISPGAIASRSGPAAQRTYLGRSGKCEEVAALAMYLASDEGDFITGENIIIDGGRTLGCLGD